MAERCGLRQAFASVPANAAPVRPAQRDAAVPSRRRAMPTELGQHGGGLPLRLQRGACAGSCLPNTKQCNGATPQTCGTDGLFHDDAKCAALCIGAGICGVCTPDAKQCNGTVPQTCSASRSVDERSRVPVRLQRGHLRRAFARRAPRRCNGTCPRLAMRAAIGRAAPLARTFVSATGYASTALRGASDAASINPSSATRAATGPTPTAVRLAPSFARGQLRRRMQTRIAPMQRRQHPANL